MVVTFGSQEIEPTMLRNKRAACRDGTSADGERNNGVCGAKMPHSTQIENQLFEIYREKSNPTNGLTVGGNFTD